MNTPENDTEQVTLTTPVYERHVESPRRCMVECRTCGRGPTTLHLYSGRDWPWKHDIVKSDHEVAYTDFEVVG